MFINAEFCHFYQLLVLLNLSTGILFEGLTMCLKRCSISSCGTNQTLLMVLRQGLSYVALWKRNQMSIVKTQEAKYVERWANTTSAWAGWSRFDIPMDRYGGVHSLLHYTSWTLGSSTCHQASQQVNTYWARYQKAYRASTLCTLW